MTISRRKLRSSRPKVAELGSKLASFVTNLMKFGTNRCVEFHVTNSMKFGSNVASFVTNSMKFGSNVASFVTHSMKFGSNVVSFVTNLMKFGLNVVYFVTKVREFKADNVGYHVSEAPRFRTPGSDRVSRGGRSHRCGRDLACSSSVGHGSAGMAPPHLLRSTGEASNLTQRLADPITGSNFSVHILTKGICRVVLRETVRLGRGGEYWRTMEIQMDCGEIPKEYVLIPLLISYRTPAIPW